jgi:hypothetical protein
MTHMNQRLRAALLAALGLVSACSSNNANTGDSTPICVGPPTDDPRCILAVNDNNFVQGNLVVTDGTSTGRIEHTPNKACMSGTLDAGPTGTGWGAILGFRLFDRDAAGKLFPFDGAAVGISQVRFTLENPPITGIMPGIVQVPSLACMTSDCFTTFVQMDASGQPLNMTAAATVTVPFSAFQQPSWGDPALMFDPTLLMAVQFTASTLSGVPLDYNFCVRDLAFLDVNGVEVTPPG